MSSSKNVESINYTIFHHNVIETELQFNKKFHTKEEFNITARLVTPLTDNYLTANALTINK